MNARGGTEVRCVNVGQRYDVEGAAVVALADVRLRIAAGQSAAVFGPSGSGKSTLLALLAGLRRPTEGEVWLGDDELGRMSERGLLRLRSREVGVVLQNPSRSLLPYGTAEDNIRFAQRAVERHRRGDLASPIELLSSLALGKLAGQRVSQLSGGEQQRLSVAVAMSTAPRLLLADEPTSQLDGPNRDRLVDLLVRVNHVFGTTLVVITHDEIVADATSQRITLSYGRVVTHEHPSWEGETAR